ncbi:MAG: purE [Bacteriovoracaceae bacterium]|nr:purE [Bacteriovoracaceae bacterium]
MKKPVAIVMGSDSDLEFMKGASEALDEFKIGYDLQILSAHRTPDEMSSFAKSASKKGVRVIIAGAGGAAHLPGMIASYSELPVIGVPVPLGALQGQDSLLSIVQMPKGVPVATVAIGNSYNAGLLAIQILASGGKTIDSKLQAKIRLYKEVLRKKVKAKSLNLRSLKRH